MEPDDFIWYTEGVRLINEKLWYPDSGNVSPNDVKDPFAAQKNKKGKYRNKIKFESYINSSGNNSKLADEVLDLNKEKSVLEYQWNQDKKIHSHNFKMDIEKLLVEKFDVSDYLKKFRNTRSKNSILNMGIIKVNPLFDDIVLSYCKKVIETKLFDKRFALNYVFRTFKKIIKISNKSYQTDMDESKEKYNDAVEKLNNEVRAYKCSIPFTAHQRDIIKGWLYEAERVYNKCIECHNNDDFPNGFKRGKVYVYKLLYPYEDTYKLPTHVPPDVLAYEVKTFFENWKSAKTNLKNGNIKKYNLKPKNISRQQTIGIYKNCINVHGIYTQRLGCVPGFFGMLNIDNFDCDCKLTYEKFSGKYYLFIPQYLIRKPKTMKKQICALDPGEKIFQTYYSLDGYGMIGEDMRVPILKIQRKIKKYQRLLNENINKKGRKLKKRNVRKRIQKLYKRIKGLVNELHKKSALYLCRNFNIILIPEFRTKKMLRKTESEKNVISQHKAKIIADNKDNPNVAAKQLSSYKKDRRVQGIKQSITQTKARIREEAKDNPIELKKRLIGYKRRRRMNRDSKFVLGQLSHYRFKQYLFSKCKEYDCLCVQVTEEYTSQLCACCGELSKVYVNRMKQCPTCHSEINRDVNGSRNILLKNIAPFLKSGLAF